MKIAILGAGGWGSAVAQLLATNNHKVYMWSIVTEEIDALIKDRENKRFLPGVILDNSIIFDTDMKKCIKDAEIIILAVPSHATRSVCKLLAPIVKNEQIILNIAKGIELGTYLRLSEVIKQEIPEAKVAVLSGPSHAEEVGRGVPTANVVSCEDEAICNLIQDVFMNNYFRVYTNPDMIGVELGGALKNVIALTAGISVGLGCGDNSNAALMTRGIAEISRLGVAMGAKAETFSGLTGTGDLIVTCMSQHSRNRRCGVLIGKGYTPEDAIKETHMVVEGVNACYAAYELSKKYNVSMPITECTYKVLKGELNAKDAIVALMGRNKKCEAEKNVLNG